MYIVSECGRDRVRKVIECYTCTHTPGCMNDVTCNMSSCLSVTCMYVGSSDAHLTNDSPVCLTLVRQRPSFLRKTKCVGRASLSS